MEGLVCRHLRLDTTQQLPGPTELSRRLIVAVRKDTEITVLEAGRLARMIRMRRVPTVAPALIKTVEVVQELIVHLSHHLDILSQAVDLVYQNLILLRQQGKVFLQALDLLLGCLE